MNANRQNIRTSKISLSTCVDHIQNQKAAPYNVMLANGTPMDRASVLSTVYALGRNNWDVLAIRLSEDIIEKEMEFSAHLMRNLAQEVALKENLPGELSSFVSEYLNPFEISEKTRKHGISWKLFVGGEKKFLRKEKYPEEIRNDYQYCFERIQELNWKPIIIIDSIEKLSNSSERFLIDFLHKHGESSVTILGGESEAVLGGFVRDQGISRQLQTAFIIPNDSHNMESNTDSEIALEIPSDVFKIGSFIINAFAIESKKFNYLKFDVWHQLGRSDFVTYNLDFDLLILGHLRMRDDYPRLIRTDYNCAVIIRVLEHPITDISHIHNFTEAAYRILMDGVSTPRGIRFEPWDSFIFLAAPEVAKFVLDRYEHLPYRNLFILLPDGTFYNLSPHKWMNHVLNNISRRWLELKEL